MGFNSQGAGSQSRAGFTTKKASGGGAGPTLTALLDIGPDFGENAKGEDNDDETWSAGLAMDDQYEVGLTGDGTVALASPGITEIGLAGDAVQAFAKDMPQIDLEGDADLGLSSGATTFNPSGLALHNFIDVPYMHYMKSVTGDNYGFVVFQQDGSNSPIGAIAVKGSDQYLYNRDDAGFTGEFSIWPETVPGVSGDEKRAYVKFPTSQLFTTGGGDMLPLSAFSFAFIMEARNAALATDANLTINLFTTPINPWDNTNYTYSLNGDQWPSDGQTARTSQVYTLDAATTEIIGLTYTFNLVNALNNNWIWLEIISDLPELVGPVKMRPFHASGQPNDYPGDGRAGAIIFTAAMWQS